MTHADHRGAARVVLIAILAALASASCSEQRPAGWSGYAEGEHIQVSAAVAGTLQRLAVRTGDTVLAGADLFHLDDANVRAAIAEADARVAAAQAQVANASKGKRADELAVIKAQLAQARVVAARAEAELRRQRALVANEFVSRSRLDDAQAAVKQARDKVDELQAALRVAALPARSDEQAAAAASAKAAQQVLAQARWRQQQTLGEAPTAGLVTDTYFNVGEFVGVGQPVLALLPPERRKARFFVSQNELGAIRVGQPVSLHCDGCGAPIAARISFISPRAEYTPPVIYSNAQRSRLVFMVEALPQAADAIRLHPGQPLDVFPAAQREGAS